MFAIEQTNPPLKVEIGVEDMLHVCFELDKTNYHLKDVMTGKVWFKKLNVEIENMEIQILKKESTNEREGELETVARFELMDGSPSSTEDVIPIKMYLRGFKNLTPSFDCPGSKFSIKNYVNLELTDIEDRKFFKKMEISLYKLDDRYYQMQREELLKKEAEREEKLKQEEELKIKENNNIVNINKS
ncbi:MAG: vacuolar protein sorting-associated family 26 protein [archaeon]|nr:vacuolar protein sorting-associated family 26 protein [archaeon]